MYNNFRRCYLHVAYYVTLVIVSILLCLQQQPLLPVGIGQHPESISNILCSDDHVPRS